MTILDTLWQVIFEPLGLTEGLTGAEFDTSLINPVLSPIYLPEGGESTDPVDQKVDTTESIAAARRQLIYLTAGTLGVVAAPAVYLATRKKSKRKGKKPLSKAEERMGIALENASTNATNLLLTGVASPVIAAAAAYILTQKLEDARIITRGLGNAAQGLMTVSAAGPLVQGIGGMATSAFRRGK